MIIQEDSCLGCGAPLREERTSCEYCGREYHVEEEIEKGTTIDHEAGYGIPFSNPLRMEFLRLDH